jgi:glycosyltransferase involved in cell wall biosynthesis
MFETTAHGSVSIIVPVYNEEATIQEVVERLLKLDIPKEIIVINDGSTDNSHTIIQSYADNITYIIHECNKGKGEAVRAGLKNATGDVVVIQDADLEYYPEVIVDVVAPLFSNECDFVFGSRFYSGYPINMGIQYRVFNKLLCWLVYVLFGVKLSDVATGCKASYTKYMNCLNLSSKGFEICEEITAKAILKQYRIKQIPIRYNPRLKIAGKKVRWTDGIIAIYILVWIFIVQGIRSRLPLLFVRK